MKHNEKIINNGLEIINKLQPQFYQKTKTFKQYDFSGELNEPFVLEAGFIAQEVLEINDLSFTVGLGDSINPYTLNYNNIWTYGIAGLQELSDKVNRLENNINNPSVSNINLNNIQTFLRDQNILIQSLNSKIINLERKIIDLEKTIN